MGNEQVIPGFDEETCDYLEIRLRRIEGQDACLAVALRGSIDAYNTGFLTRSLMKAVDAGFTQLVLVLPGVDYVSSTGVGTLLALLRTFMEKGGGPTLVNPHPRVMEILRLMILHTFFSCSDSMDDALLSSAGNLLGSVDPVRESVHVTGAMVRTRMDMNNDRIVPGFDTESCDFLDIVLTEVPGLDACLALRIKGQIDTYSSTFLLRCTAKSIDAGFFRLILVLDEVEYLSSKAVGTFVQIKNTVAGKGGAIAIVNGNPKTRNVFRNLRLDKFLCCTDSLEDAVAGMAAS